MTRIEQIHFSPDMDVSTPFRPRKAGARAFWDMVRSHYAAGRGKALINDGTRKHFKAKTPGDHAKTAVIAAFFRGWQVNRDGGRLDVPKLAVMYGTSKHATPGHLIAAHINGFDFYAEQFPLEEERAA